MMFIFPWHFTKSTQAALSRPCSQYEIMFFWTLRLRVCLQSWTDGRALRSPGCTPHELIQNPVDLSQRKSSPISASRALSTAATSWYGVPRSQSALCCIVLFTLFVVLNLIVINIFDLLCIGRACLWKELLCMVGASFWNVLIIRIPLFWDFPPSFKNSISQQKKLKYSFIVLVLRQILCWQSMMFWFEVTN